MAPSFTPPPADCLACPRLAGLRRDLQKQHPQWHNRPVPAFGDLSARLLVVGLAPGLNGANRTGRPFTGDYAGDLLYQTLLDFGFAAGRYGADPADGLTLVDCRITNAVRCLPPENKPTTAEIAACRSFLVAEIAAMPRLEAILSLGRIAHAATAVATGHRPSALPFGHGRQHRLNPAMRLFNSYHCSRYNTNTGRLTPTMFQAVFAEIRAALAAVAP